MATPINITNRAGSRRRARRAQNFPSWIVSFFRHSPTNREVIRNPERTKNTSMVRNPPPRTGTPPVIHHHPEDSQGPQSVEGGNESEGDGSTTGHGGGHRILGWLVASRVGSRTHLGRRLRTRSRTGLVRPAG